MESWWLETAKSAGAASGIVLCLGAGIVWLIKDRARILEALDRERQLRETEHAETRRLMTTYQKTLEALTERILKRR